ncbi:MAG TPA: hypothetical protein VHP33_02450 [Polyangiaceae bacterium]|nr:hypothetical protein [Polyangiaceae bacterium]
MLSAAACGILVGACSDDDDDLVGNAGRAGAVGHAGSRVHAEAP